MSKPEKYSAGEWEHFRKRLTASILVETEIAKLGQTVNLSWPFKGGDETPSKYIDYDFEELKSVPGLVNKEKRIHLLMDIFRETLAFDDPFSDMVETVEAQGEKDDTFERILQKLGIPGDYPAELVHLSPETASLVDSEKIGSLLELIEFGQNIARNAVIGGDLRSFLNTLAHRDEKGLGRYLPFRPGEKGLHFVQALGLAVERLRPEVRLEVLRQTGLQLTDEEEGRCAALGRDAFEDALRGGLGEVERVCRRFPDEAAELERTLREDDEVDRFFISLSEPRKERVAIALCRTFFAIGEEADKSGLMGRIAGLFRR